MSYLKYPFDVSNILRKKKSIRKSLLATKDHVDKNIAVLGGSTTAEIINILELFLLQNGIKPNFYESEYCKFYEDALFGNESLDKFKPDIIYIHTSLKNIAKFPSFGDSNEDVEALVIDEIDKYKSIWSALERFDCPIIQNNFEFPEHRSLGNLDCYDIHGKTYFINKINEQLSSEARAIINLHINDINYLSSYIGLKNWHDSSLWHQAKYSLSLDSIPELAFNISKIVNTILGKAKKCLVLDLDNTCWGGVIGDDGIDGIQIGTETAVAESYTAFQKYIFELYTRGVTLAVCSKNDMRNAEEGFSHPDSVLKYDHFTSFKANWEPKNLNILAIAKEINIGVDSLVFIDDNPFERDLVSSQIPNIAVPEVGENIVDYISHLDRNGFFEPIFLSQEDLNRNQYYEENKKRSATQAVFDSYDDFLVSLEMSAEIKPFSSIYIDRIAQLSNKTNQFNLTTRRYTPGEIRSIMTDPEYVAIYGKLSDKYGCNGVVAVCIGRIEDSVCHIDLWIMSCRVIKRGMEFSMLDAFVDICRERNITKIKGYFFKTAKNSMVSELYQNFGFSLDSTVREDSIWSLDLLNYEHKGKYIRRSDD